MGNFSFRMSGPEEYVSPKAKGDFTREAGIVIGAALVLFFMLPFFAFFIYAFNGYFDIFFEEHATGNFHNSVFFNGKIWYITSFLKKSKKCDLVSLEPSANAQPEIVIGNFLSYPELFADKDRFFIVDLFRIKEFKDGTLKDIKTDRQLNYLSKYFIFKGEPAALEITDKEQYFCFLKDGKWKKEESFAIKPALNVPWVKSDCQTHVLTAGNDIYLFYSHKSREAAYCRINNDFTCKPEDWKMVPVEGNYISFATVNGKPSVINTEKGRVTVTQLDGDQWKEISSVKTGRIYDFNIFSGKNPDEMLLIWGNTGSNNIEVDNIKGDVLSQIVSIGKKYEPLKLQMISNIFTISIEIIILTAVLVLLSGVMKKYKISAYTVNGSVVTFASLMQRGFARGIDVLIVYLPILICFIIYSKQYLEFMEGKDIGDLISPLMIFPVMLVSMAIAAVIAVIIWLMEGKWGQTPGKMVIGIKTVNRETLLPCGPISAIVRNLLFIVDGIIHFLTGIFFIAFFTNRQRFGDIIAGTIVIEKQASGSENGISEKSEEEAGV
ncbi:MAG: RDD family protein [Firmicutes bacterium]|nr:RDD family protein [Bacillota bacterium]